MRRASRATGARSRYAFEVLAEGLAPFVDDADDRGLPGRGLDPAGGQQARQAPRRAGVAVRSALPARGHQPMVGSGVRAASAARGQSARRSPSCAPPATTGPTPTKTIRSTSTTRSGCTRPPRTCCAPSVAAGRPDGRAGREAPLGLGARRARSSRACPRPTRSCSRWRELQEEYSELQTQLDEARNVAQSATGRSRAVLPPAGRAADPVRGRGRAARPVPEPAEAARGASAPVGRSPPRTRASVRVAAGVGRDGAGRSAQGGQPAARSALRRPPVDRA